MNEFTPSTLIRDFTGLLLIGFSLLALTALVSFSPEDPSFNKFVSGPAPVQNLGGPVGACLADGLAQLFGAGAFIFPFLVGLAGWAVIRGKRVIRFPVVLIFGPVFLASVCTWLNVQFPADPWFGEAAHAGGVIGAAAGPVLVTWLNPAGAKLVLAILWFISLTAILGISVNALIDGAANAFMALGGAAAAGASRTGRGLQQGAGEARSRFQEWRRILHQAQKERVTAKRRRQQPVIVSTRESSRRGKRGKSEDSKPSRNTPGEPFAVAAGSPLPAGGGDYKIPPVVLLSDPPPGHGIAKMRQELLGNSDALERKLGDFGIRGKVVQVLPGPVITLYEFEPAPGIKVSRILSLSDDLALAMRAPNVRILAPVPGKAVVGIELPNPRREVVSLKEIIGSPEFEQTASRLAIALGKDHVGRPVVQDLAQVPHLLVAGATGSGKSVGINAMICSILLNAAPDEVKLIMIDPKMLELSMYDGIPHLIAPVVTNPKKAAAALQWAVSEMEARYKVMADCGVRNITGYNLQVEDRQKELEKQRRKQARTARRRKTLEPLDTGLESEGSGRDEAADAPQVPEKFPYIVIVIDELADLMMVASKGVEDSLTRLAQMARAAGIHLITATQRPSVDVLTGIIKANFPARISFQVTSRVDSRTILDSVGAERLLGKGDMLFLPPGTSRLRRIHGAMVSDEEITRILNFIKRQNRKPGLHDDVFDQVKVEDRKVDAESEYDALYDQAVALVAQERQASISMVQRRLRIGYNRAARIIEIMEREGVVGPSDGLKPRDVYVKPITFE
ncbi:MAG: DNA translocase FtsK [Nitrospinaceae bacterium]